MYSFCLQEAYKFIQSAIFSYENEVHNTNIYFVISEQQTLRNKKGF